MSKPKSLSTGKTFYATNKFKHCHFLKTDATYLGEFSLEGCDILCLGYKNRQNEFLRIVAYEIRLLGAQNAQEHLPINNKIRLS